MATESSDAAPPATEVPQPESKAPDPAPALITQPDGSTFEFRQLPSEGLVIVSNWPNMKINLLISYKSLCRAGWDQKTFPHLSEFVPLDAVEAVKLFLQTKTPSYYDPHVRHRMSEMVRFIRAWTGCRQAAWEGMTVDLESVAPVLTGLPIDPDYLLPVAASALQHARDQQVELRQLDGFLLNFMVKELQKRQAGDLADLLRMDDVHSAMTLLVDKTLPIARN